MRQGDGRLTCDADGRDEHRRRRTMRKKRRREVVRDRYPAATLDSFLAAGIVTLKNLSPRTFERKHTSASLDVPRFPDDSEVQLDREDQPPFCLQAAASCRVAYRRPQRGAGRGGERQRSENIRGFEQTGEWGVEHEQVKRLSSGIGRLSLLERIALGVLCVLLAVAAVELDDRPLFVRTDR